MVQSSITLYNIRHLELNREARRLERPGHAVGLHPGCAVHAPARAGAAPASEGGSMLRGYRDDVDDRMVWHDASDVSCLCYDVMCQGAAS